MKTLLINISLRPNSEQLYLPIGLGYIATAIEKAGFDFDILDIDGNRYSDMEIENYLAGHNYDAIAFGCIVTGYKKIKYISHLIKKYQTCPIICGNSVASSIPEILLHNTEVDIAVIGEGDLTIIELLKAIEENKSIENIDGIAFLKNNKVRYTNPRKPIENLDDIPFINWDLFDIETYITKMQVREPKPEGIIRPMVLNTARGCPYKCTFCYHCFKNYKYRVRSPESICKEIKLLKNKYGINYVSFFDDLTFYSANQCEKFVDTIIEENLGIYWTGSCTANLFKEKHLNIIQKMKASGCVAVGFALESADKNILKDMNKPITVDNFNQQTKLFHKSGIPTSTSLVIGYPKETKETLKKTFDCCYKNGLYPSVGYILPQPGSPIYNYAIKKKLIRSEEEYLLSIGDRQDFSINFTDMKQEEIEGIVKNHLMRISNKLNLRFEDPIKIGVEHATK